MNKKYYITPLDIPSSASRDSEITTWSGLHYVSSQTLRKDSFVENRLNVYYTQTISCLNSLTHTLPLP